MELTVVRLALPIWGAPNDMDGSFWWFLVGIF